MTKKGIVRRIRRSFKNSFNKVDWREVSVRDIDADNFIGDWPNSGEKFAIWISADIGYVHVGLE